MNDASTITASFPDVTVRHVSEDELPHLFRSRSRSRPSDGADPFSSAPLVREMVVWVAEVESQVAGSAVCAVVWPSASLGASPFRPLAEFVRRLVGLRENQPGLVELLDLAVSPQPFSAAVERALLARLVEQLQHSWRRVPVAVPESSLVAQLFLRDAGYRAIRVLRDYFVDEDGYLMAHGRPGLRG